MLNIRTIILSVVFVLVLLFTVRLVTARTEVVSNPSGEAARVSSNQEQSANWSEAPVPPYRARLMLDECFDVPFSEAARCWNERQAPAP